MFIFGVKCSKITTAQISAIIPKGDVSAWVNVITIVPLAPRIAASGRVLRTSKRNPTNLAKLRKSSVLYPVKAA